MEFVELTHEELKILDEWFKDKELMDRLGGILPLQDWFGFVQENPNYYTWMVYSKGTAVGQISLEISSDNSASISILTNPALLNQGYGKKMINTLLQRPEISTVEIIKVGIEQDNIVSRHIFKQVGFIEEGIDEDNFINFSLKLNH